ncbi:MAG: RagB/SusD family nutrient uptake outer membrane protein [Prevotella sp.]|nr:RagB/SusD family nutrient uptake outer membrane protein [Prevotella sp.]
MKQNMIKLFCAICVICGFTSCDDKLDITPKGKVTLGTVSELELLLNQEYLMNDEPSNSLGILCGETVGMFDQVSTVLSQKNTVKYALMAYDESVDRAILTTDDARYSALYQYINYMNTVITMMPSASGDESRKAPLMAEARVMRAWLHFLAAVIYAPQYDEATVATAGGIAYVTETDVTAQKTKGTLADTYRQILDDCADDVIAQLPDDHGDMVMRGDKAWGNAVRAMVLLQMKRYAEALPYAQQAITLRPQMFDRASIKQTGTWTQEQGSANNLLYMGGATRVSPTMAMLTQETGKLFEKGDYVINYDSPGWSLEYGKMYAGIDGIRMYMGWTAQCNVYGLTSEQLHYVAAECLIRTGRIAEGLALVDDVRSLRIEDASPSAASTEQEAMAILQKAKFIECIATPYNFMDRKRWNTEPQYQRDIVHKLGTLGTYTLRPESPLWIQPFPTNAVRYNPSLTQNY